jgi:lipopolysaccharide biosynthesis glycosyltransferase
VSPRWLGSQSSIVPNSFLELDKAEIGVGHQLRIAITTATDAGYLPAACCQLKSVFDYLEIGAAEAFLIVCDVAPEQHANAEMFFSRRGLPVTIIKADAVAEKIRPVASRWPRAAYLRLYFDELFDRSFDRLVYFDADTRLRSPVMPLLGADLRGRPAGAVHDFIYYVTGNIRRRRRELELGTDGPYLQSGVMVFDWPAMLDLQLLAKARDFLASNAEACLEAPDQDALNHALIDLWTPLDPRWNLHETYLNFGGRLEPYLEHYTSTKPWSRRRPPRWSAAADWYAEQLKDTIWSGFVQPQTARDRLKARFDFLKFRYGPKLRNIFSRHTPFLLDLMNVPRVRTDWEELPWAPRNRRDVEDMACALVDEAAGHRPLIRPPESVLRGFGRGRPIGL